MFYPSLEEVEKLSASCKIIPISMRARADMETPISLFKRIENQKHSFLLESVEGGEKWARYSFMGCNPFLTLKAINNELILSYTDGKEVRTNENPVEALKRLMEDYKGPDLPDMPRFNGGAVGYFGYDLIRYYENLPNIPYDDLQLPDCFFMFAGELIAFDHLKQTIQIIVNINANVASISDEYEKATKRIGEIYEQISKPADFTVGLESGGAIKSSPFESNITKEQYCENVEKAKEYIRNGDIFQVVLSQRLMLKTNAHPFNVYRALRVINPSPYMYYLKMEDLCIVGASPEMLVRVENGIAQTCPIAGTRKRGKTEQEDINLEKELLEDEKERSEHTMLVDLGRNDIGKIARFGTVKVKDFMRVDRYSHVMHIVSDVQGELREDLTPFDALMSVLPAGTLSGAPKVRAMEIIDELETVKRGPYGGAIGYLSFNGNIDSCITIRTMIFKEGKAYVQAGAGIVANSVPENEYEECLNKAMAVLKAVGEGEAIL